MPKIKIDKNIFSKNASWSFDKNEVFLAIK